MVCVVIESLEFLIILILVPCLTYICRYFLLFCWLSLLFYRCFGLSQNPFVYFSFCFFIFKDLSKKPLSIQKFKVFSWCFAFLICFIVSGFICRPSLITGEKQIQFYSSLYGFTIVPASLIEKTFFFQCVSISPVLKIS